MYVLVLLGVTIVNECIFLYFTGKRMNNLCIFMFIYDKIKSFSFNHRFIALVYNVTLLYDYNASGILHVLSLHLIKRIMYSNESNYCISTTG